MGAAASQLLDSAAKGDVTQVRILVQRHPDCIHAVYEQVSNTDSFSAIPTSVSVTRSHVVALPDGALMWANAHVPRAFLLLP
jgi:hypothetical protein